VLPVCSMISSIRTLACKQSSESVLDTFRSAMHAAISSLEAELARHQVGQRLEDEAK